MSGTLTARELRQLRLSRQHLTSPADRQTVVRHLCGVQAQWMSNAIHSLRLRCTDFDETNLDGLTKNWTIRGTVHVFAQEDIPLFLHCRNGTVCRSQDWSIPSFWNQREDWALTPQRQAALSRTILDALAQRPHTREELKAICRAAGMTSQEEGSLFHPWGGGVRELCERGFMGYIPGEKKEFRLLPPFTPIAEAEARQELLRRYLTHMAPATVRDISYFFQYPQREVKALLSRLPVETISVEGVEHFYLGGLGGDCPEIPDCLFLAGFDQLMLAYEKQTSVFLPPESLRGIFLRSGIVMPAVLLDGTVAGRWKKERHKLTVTPLRPLFEAEKTAICAAAETLWGGEIRDLRL